MPKNRGIGSYVDPRNWGVEDYSKEKTFNTAYRKARKKGINEFLYGDKKYSTELADKPDRSDAPNFNTAFRASRNEGNRGFYYNGKEYTTNLVDKKFEENYNKGKQFVFDYANAYQEIVPGEKKEIIERLNKPIYTSLTTQPGVKNPALGYYQPTKKKKREDKMFISGRGDVNDLTTPVHEYAHKAGFFMDSPVAGKKGTQTDPYVGNPYERAARHLSTKYYLNSKGVNYDKFGQNEYNQLSSSLIKKELPVDVEQLMELYGDDVEFINQMNKPMDYRKYLKGGRLRKRLPRYDIGGSGLGGWGNSSGGGGGAGNSMFNTDALANNYMGQAASPYYSPENLNTIVQPVERAPKLSDKDKGSLIGTAGQLVGSAIESKKALVDTDYTRKLQDSRKEAKAALYGIGSAASAVNPIVGGAIIAGTAIGSAVGSQTVDKYGRYKSRVGNALDEMVNPVTGYQGIKRAFKGQQTTSGALNKLTLGIFGKSDNQKEAEESKREIEAEEMRGIRARSQDVLANYNTAGAGNYENLYAIGGKLMKNRRMNRFGMYPAGGMLPYPTDNSGVNQLASNVAQYSGDTHATGGIPLDTNQDQQPDIEVENREVIKDDMVLSNRLRPSRDMKSVLKDMGFRGKKGESYAKLAARMAKMKGKWESLLNEPDTTHAQKNSAMLMAGRVDEGMNMLFQDQEMRKGTEGQVGGEMMPYGGYVDPSPRRRRRGRYSVEAINTTPPPVFPNVSSTPVVPLPNAPYSTPENAPPPSAPFNIEDEIRRVEAMKQTPSYPDGGNIPPRGRGLFRSVKQAFTPTPDPYAPPGYLPFDPNAPPATQMYNVRQNKQTATHERFRNAIGARKLNEMPVVDSAYNASDAWLRQYDDTGTVPPHYPYGGNIDPDPRKKLGRYEVEAMRRDPIPAFTPPAITPGQPFGQPVAPIVPYGSGPSSSSPGGYTPFQPGINQQYQQVPTASPPVPSQTKTFKDMYGTPTFPKGGKFSVPTSGKGAYSNVNFGEQEGYPFNMNSVRSPLYSKINPNDPLEKQWKTSVANRSNALTTQIRGGNIAEADSVMNATERWQDKNLDAYMDSQRGKTYASFDWPGKRRGASVKPYPDGGKVRYFQSATSDPMPKYVRSGQDATRYNVQKPIPVEGYGQSQVLQELLNQPSEFSQRPTPPPVYSKINPNAHYNTQFGTYINNVATANDARSNPAYQPQADSVINANEAWHREAINPYSKSYKSRVTGYAGGGYLPKYPGGGQPAYGQLPSMQPFVVQQAMSQFDPYSTPEGYGDEYLQNMALDMPNYGAYGQPSRQQMFQGNAPFVYNNQNAPNVPQPNTRQLKYMPRPYTTEDRLMRQSGFNYPSQGLRNRVQSQPFDDPRMNPSRRGLWGGAQNMPKYPNYPSSNAGEGLPVPNTLADLRGLSGAPESVQGLYTPQQVPQRFNQTPPTTAYPAGRGGPRFQPTQINPAVLDGNTNAQGGQPPYGNQRFNTAVDLRGLSGMPEQVPGLYGAQQTPSNAPSVSSMMQPDNAQVMQIAQATGQPPEVVAQALQQQAAQQGANTQLPSTQPAAIQQAMAQQAATGQPAATTQSLLTGRQGFTPRGAPDTNPLMKMTLGKNRIVPVKTEARTTPRYVGRKFGVGDYKGDIVSGLGTIANQIAIGKMETEYKPDFIQTPRNPYTDRRNYLIDQANQQYNAAAQGIQGSSAHDNLALRSNMYAKTLGSTNQALDQEQQREDIMGLRHQDLLSRVNALNTGIGNQAKYASMDARNQKRALTQQNINNALQSFQGNEYMRDLKRSEYSQNYLNAAMAEPGVVNRYLGMLGDTGRKNLGYDTEYDTKYVNVPRAYGGSFKKGGIYIKPENRGKFNALKKRTGKTTEQLKHSKNPLTRKRATFAANAKKWKH